MDVVTVVFRGLLAMALVVTLAGCILFNRPPDPDLALRADSDQLESLFVRTSMYPIWGRTTAAREIGSLSGASKASCYLSEAVSASSSTNPAMALTPNRRHSTFPMRGYPPSSGSTPTVRFPTKPAMMTDRRRGWAPLTVGDDRERSPLRAGI